MRSLTFASLLLLSLTAFAQESQTAAPAAQAIPSQNQPATTQVPQLTSRVPAGAMNTITVPAGTRVPVILEHGINTKSARDGDAVYCRTNFPVVVDGKVAIPPGTYVQGVITNAKRAGRVKGKAEVLMNFTSLIFPSGYTVMLPGSLGGMPGSDTAQIKENDKEGTVAGDSNKTGDAATVGKVAAAGAGVGGIAGVSRGASGKGTLIGGAAGAVAGLATVLLTRGPDVRIENGTLLEMTLDRGIVIDVDRAKQKQ